MNKPLILLTGASGYVGAALLPLLLEQGYSVRRLSRSALPAYSTDDDLVHDLIGNVLEAETLTKAMEGVHTAFYLIHSMNEAYDFEQAEQNAATNFAKAAQAAKIQRIIYLGGLADDNESLSPHMRSRIKTGEILSASGILTIELRASIVIGSGSLSFEMIRSLTQRLPIMLTPSWVRTEAQPIYINDLLSYLTASITLPLGKSEVFEIGGPDTLSYEDLIRAYTVARKLRRLLIPVPVLSPKLSSLWLNLITPLYARVGRKLIESVRHASTIRNPAAKNYFNVTPTPIHEAIQQALDQEYKHITTRSWKDGTALPGPKKIDQHRCIIQASPKKVFDIVQRIGGEQGWYYANSLWKLRGWLDQIIDGVGMKRGRRHPSKLVIGDYVDCWRVIDIQAPARLLLEAEMKLPGTAWLCFELCEQSDGTTELIQTAVFDPKGLVGLVYWHSVSPLHLLVFKGMLRSIKRAAETT